MTRGEPAAAWIPVSEYEKLEKVVTSETGELWENKAEFIESAMRMFIDEDDLRAEVERLIEIDDMLACLIGDYSRRRRSSDAGITVIPSEWSDEPTKRLNERIDPDLKERFKTWTLRTRT